MASKHTIVLLQTAPAAASRTYFDFSTPAQAYDAIARMYEDRLKQINPNARNITYDVQDLFRYLDSLQDISLLILDVAAKKYEPYPRDYVKQQIYEHLKKQAGGR